LPIEPRFSDKPENDFGISRLTSLGYDAKGGLAFDIVEDFYPEKIS
jgi:hypothetical protein